MILNIKQAVDALRDMRDGSFTGSVYEAFNDIIELIEDIETDKDKADTDVTELQSQVDNMDTALRYIVNAAADVGYTYD